jgi:hypothetical protein
MACGFSIDSTPLEVPDAINATYAQELKSEVLDMVECEIKDLYTLKWW